MLGGHRVRSFLGFGLTVTGIRSVDAMNRASVLEVPVVTFESTLLHNKTRFTELDSPLASKSSELDMAPVEL